MFKKFLTSLFKKREEAAAQFNNGVDDDDMVKPFLDHLEDLRWTLWKMLVALGVCMVAAFCFRTQLAAFLEHPLVAAVGRENVTIISTDPIESITVSFTLAFYAGIVASFPLLMYFLGEFVLPALTRKEKRYVVPAILVGFILFLGGVTFAYTFILPTALHWLHGDAQAFAKPMWALRPYYGFVTHVCLAVGLVCEMPVVIAVLSGIGVISFQWLRGMRIYGYALSLILAGVVAPTPDPMMLMVFFVPLALLFEGCIWMVWLLEKRRAKLAAKAASEGDPLEPLD